MSRYNIFDRNKLDIKSVKLRKSKSDISIMIDPDEAPPKIEKSKMRVIDTLACKIKRSRENGRPVVLAYGAHLFKNGCSPVIVRMIEEGYVQQLLTNGAGVIHDFEIAYMGKTEEDVRYYMAEGQFGLWDETGKYLNQCLIDAAAEDKGYGEKVGECMDKEIIGKEKVEFPYKKFSVVYAAYRSGVPFSSCIGIGQDIIHTHPLCDGAAMGKASYTDFLLFAETISKIEGGVIMSVGSAVMAPMVIEKSLSMAKNLARQEGRTLNNYAILVNDIQPGEWDWSKGEPPKDSPAYYLRFCKSFSRMSNDFTYLCLDNRVFVHNLYWRLK